MMVEKASSPREIAEVFLHGVSKQEPEDRDRSC
jgi:hypothetical protein